MTKEEKAIKLIQPIKYEPFEFAYYVTKNEEDMGDSDFCVNCIDGAVQEARKYHKEKREEILSKFNQIADTGYFKVGRKKIKVKGVYTQSQILKAKRYELKEYRAKVSFGYERHDPDFGGGLTEPCSCENCGEYFSCNFTPNQEEAQYLLEIMKKPNRLSDRNKWELDIALSNCEYVNSDVKKILRKISEKIISTQTK